MPVVKATYGAGRSVAASFSRRAIPAFTLVDLLVSMAIIAVLISLLLPSLSGIREATRRVVCSSNQRQQGLGLAMYTDDWGEPPQTQWDPKDASASRGQPAPQNTNIVRDVGTAFDGLGILFEAQYLNAPQVFYCPSHHGTHPYGKYASAWHEDEARVVVNFQYRGASRSSLGQPERFSLLTDGLATRADYNHKVGSNVLRADFSVSWLPDPSGSIARLLPLDDSDLNAAAKVSDAWDLIEATPNTPGHSGP